jgi:precorrin-6Y C5,15-methyltransferase (decarboxylating)
VADHVHVLGVGADGPAPAAGVPDTPALVVAAERFRDLAARRWPDVHFLPFGALDPTVDAIDRADGDVVVLASGDPGWLGIARTLVGRLGREHVSWHPAVSSVAAAFAHAGVPWDDARVVSAHGRDPHAAVAVVCAHPKVAVLTSPEYGPAELGRDLLAADCAPREVTVVERLGHADERVRRTDLVATADLTDVRDPNVVVLLDPARPGGSDPVTLAPPTDVPDRWALPATAFEHRDQQISKPEVRAVALAHLAPRPGTVVWDVGAGTGAVGIECARFGASVYAVELDPDQRARIDANARYHDVAVRVVPGAAPDALADLPAPDAVFIGGGGADLPAILPATVAASRPAGRIVVALATLERVVPAQEQLIDAGWSVSVQMFQVHDLTPLGDGHRLSPRNPVVLVLAEQPR